MNAARKIICEHIIGMHNVKMVILFPHTFVSSRKWSHEHLKQYCVHLSVGTDSMAVKYKPWDYNCITRNHKNRWHTLNETTHWGRGTHSWVSKLTIIGSDNGLSPGRRRSIVCTSTGILLIRTQRTNISEILIKFRHFHSRKRIRNCEMAAICIGLDVIMYNKAVYILHEMCLTLGIEMHFYLTTHHFGFYSVIPSSCCFQLIHHDYINHVFWGYIFTRLSDDIISLQEHFKVTSYILNV